MADAPHLGILAGLRAEADVLIEHLPKDLKVTIYLSGAVPAQARKYAARLIDDGATHLLSFGYAGGLDPAFWPGTLLVPRSIVAPDGTVYQVDGEWLEQAMNVLQPLYPAAGAHLGVDTAVAEIEQKATLFLRTRGAFAADMESHALAAAARERDVPFLAIRVVLDSATHIVPGAATASVRPDGSISMLRLAGALALRPHQIGALNRLSRAQQAAEKTLLSCCSRGGPVGFGVRKLAHRSLDVV
jgi:nucleoside phosphorylase